MKNKIEYIISLAFCALLFVSCNKDYLTPVPQTSVQDAYAFDTPERILNQVRGMYQGKWLSALPYEYARARVPRLGKRPRRLPH